jgi:hypothetical protein
MDLTGPRAKLDWAAQQLGALDRECSAHLETKPFHVAAEFEDGSHVVRFHGRKDMPVFRWGLMVGDVVHNARSALDQAVWLIACRSTPVETLWQPDVGWKISFPVTQKRSGFLRHKVMPFLAEDAKAVLEAMQPYQEGDIPKSLERLDRLWNIDKHRVIHSTTVQLDIAEITLRPGAIHIEDLMGHPPETEWHKLPNPIPDGTALASVRFKDGQGPPYTTVEVIGEPSVLLGFGSGFFALPIDGIGKLLVDTAEVLSKIETLPEAID